MRILRLTNSNDFTSDVSEDARGYRVIEAALAQVTGEPVETIPRRIWPSDSLPDTVDRWIEKYQPDLVFLKFNNFWYSYESVPLRLRRKLGPVGRLLGDGGLKAADTPWLANNRAFRKLRYWAQAAIGGDTHFTVDYVAGNMEAVMRRVLRHEEVILVARGSRGGRDRLDLPPSVRARHQARRKEATERFAALCAELNVPFIRGNQFRPWDPTDRGRDMFHSNEKGHRSTGEFEAQALVEIWRRLHPETPAPVDQR